MERYLKSVVIVQPCVKQPRVSESSSETAILRATPSCTPLESVHPFYPTDSGSVHYQRKEVWERCSESRFRTKLMNSLLLYFQGRPILKMITAYIHECDMREQKISAWKILIIRANVGFFLSPRIENSTGHTIMTWPHIDAATETLFIESFLARAIWPLICCGCLRAYANDTILLRSTTESLQNN